MSFTSSLSPHFLSLPNQTQSLTTFNSSKPLSFPKLHPKPLITTVTKASSSSSSKNSSNNPNPNQSKENEIVEVEVEEELPWIQEKALDLVEFTGSVTQAIPGPRVGPTSLPWILAVPIGYAGLTFVIAFVKTVRKFSSPKAQRRKLVGKNAMLCKSVDELLQRGRDEVKVDDLKAIANKTGFGLEEILRKYIRYVLNEKPFNPDVVADLIQLRRASTLNDSQVAGILNEISRRIVRDKGPIVMNKSGYTEKGFKRKLAVQALFGKVFYLSELPEFCSSDSSLLVKETFGVTDEDADQLRLQTTSEAGNLDALEKMADISDSEDSSEAS
ncbi:ribosomal RNA small subunit methyltransferase J [Trifolium repens]|nr:ribosomal RNA small subunit methyltransferase J [Trifolium repens]